MTSQEPPPQEPISTRIRQLTEAVGPTTPATALLIYFGYVATRARFDYFGVSLEMTGLSNQSLLLKDPASAYRYRGFRLLLASGGRLFLVSGTWTLGRDQTIVVPYDNGIRIQLVSQP